MPSLPTHIEQLTTPFDIHPIFHIIPAKLGIRGHEVFRNLDSFVPLH